MEGDIGSSFASIKIPLTLSSEQEKIIDSQSLLSNKLYNLLIEEVTNEYLVYCEAIKNTRVRLNYKLYNKIIKSIT